MDTVYVVLILTSLAALIGFLLRQSLLDRDRRINEIDADLDIVWAKVNELTAVTRVQENQIDNELKQLEQLGRKIDRMGDL